MSDIREVTKIYIIESQRDSDILCQRFEGKALSASLDLSEIENEYFQIVSKEMFEFCITQISKDIYIKNRSGNLVIPYLHFSSHGDENGIILTDNTYLNWKSLRNYIDRINSVVGFITLPTKPDMQLSILNLCFSVCKGFCAKEIQGDLKDHKYVCLVGPIDKVDWSDSLIAFTTFYHQIFYKHKTAKDAILNMNSAAGLENIFQISMGSGTALA